MILKFEFLTSKYRLFIRNSGYFQTHLLFLSSRTAGYIIQEPKKGRTVPVYTFKSLKFRNVV